MATAQSGTLAYLGSPPDGTDANTLQTSGYYTFPFSTSAATMINLPSPIAGVLEVLIAAASVGYQRYTTFGDVDTNVNSASWMRLRASSTTWGRWGEVGEAYLHGELIATSGRPVDLNTFTVPGIFSVKNVTNAQYINGLPVAKAGTLENVKPRAATSWTQRFTVQGFMDSSLDGQDAESYYRARKDATSWNPWRRYITESVGPIPEGALKLEATTAPVIPLSIGVDGYLYGTTGDPSIVVRSGDALATAPERGMDFDTFAGTGRGVAWFTRTSAGFVAVWTVDANNSSIWFSPTFTGPFHKVQDIGPFSATGLSKPVTIAATTWMLLGEYINGTYPSKSLARWLSRDGGQTWQVIKRTPLVDTAVNSHMHTALIRPDGRIYTSDGDGVNSYFGYSDDLGKSWVPVATDPDINRDGSYGPQPTCLIDFGDIIALSPDRGRYSPGMWRMDPAGHDMKVAFELEEGGPYMSASAQYARSLYAQVGPQGKWAYALMPDGGSGNKTSYVVATPDGGKRWHVVARIPWGAGHLLGGIVGPDRMGYVHMRGYNLPTYGANAIRAKIIDWERLSV